MWGIRSVERDDGTSRHVTVSLRGVTLRPRRGFATSLTTFDARLRRDCTACNKTDTIRCASRHASRLRGVLLLLSGVAALPLWCERFAPTRWWARWAHNATHARVGGNVSAPHASTDETSTRDVAQAARRSVTRTGSPRSGNHDEPHPTGTSRHRPRMTARAKRATQRHHHEGTNERSETPEDKTDNNKEHNTSGASAPPARPTRPAPHRVHVTRGGHRKEHHHPGHQNENNKDHGGEAPDENKTSNAPNTQRSRCGPRARSARRASYIWGLNR